MPHASSVLQPLLNSHHVNVAIHEPEDVSDDHEDGQEHVGHM